MNNLDWKVDQSVKVIKEAYKIWYPNIGLAFTGKKDSTVLAHLICSHVSRATKALFIDHGHHFPETVSNVVKVSKKWNLDLIVVKDDSNTKKMSKNKLMKQIFLCQQDFGQRFLKL